MVKPVGRCKLWGVIFGNSQHDEQTKTGTQDDTVFLDCVHDFAPSVLKLVFHACRSPHDPLFPDCTLALYESTMRDVLQQLGLGQPTPHAVRHFGPSVDFLNKTRTADEIMARGRWVSHRYRKPGQMLAKMNRIPKEIWDQAATDLPFTLNRLKQFYGGR